MRMIPANILSGFLGMGYDADHSEIYTSTALDFKCLGFWRFNETTKYQNIDTAFNEIINLAPYGVHGNLSTAGATHSTANGNIELGGTTGFIDLGNYYNFAYNEPITISAWPNLRSASSESVIISKQTTVPVGWKLSYTSSKQFEFLFKCATVSGNEQFVLARSCTTYSTGTERNIVITYDGNRSSTGIKMFVNNASVATSYSTVTSGLINTSNTDDDSLNNAPCQIGARDGIDLFANAVINDVGIWNRLLSTATANITDLYGAGSGTTIKFINHVPDVAYMVHMVKMELTSNYYYTNSDINIIYNDGTGNQTYLSRGFSVPNIEYSASPSVDQVSIEFDNVDLNFSSLVLGEEVRGKTVKIYLANLNKVPQVITKSLLFLGIIDSVNITRQKATFNLLSHMYLWQKRIPKRRHASRCQWTFKDALTCKYAGADTVCDKSWDDCNSAGKTNTANFGGFRWLPALVDKQIWWGRVPK